MFTRLLSKRQHCESVYCILLLRAAAIVVVFIVLSETTRAHVLCEILRALDIAR